MQNEISKLRDSYHRLIEDGNNVQEFAGTEGWNWYVSTVLQPTVDDYTAKILEGKLDEREDMVMRGYVNAFKMLISSTEGFISGAQRAREDAKELEEKVKAANDE